MKPWKIALAEPHVLVREALRQLLADDKDIAVVGEAADAAGVRAIATKLTPDVLFLNASLLGAKLSIADILDENPGTSIVILTENREEEDLVDYLRAGAKGILTKEEIAAPLVKALKAAATGTLLHCACARGALLFYSSLVSAEKIVLSFSPAGGYRL